MATQPVPENRPAIKVKPDADDFTTPGGAGLLPAASGDKAAPDTAGNRPATPAQLG
jgi:hypothetical protein